MRTASKLWKDLYLRLGEVNTEYPLDNAVIKQTMRPWEYGWRAKEIFERFKIKNSILEIGCGYGGLAHEILKIRSVSYTMVDNELMLVQARKLLGDRVTYVDAKDIRTLRNKKYELFISYNCLCETPLEYRKYILKNIIKNCENISVVDYEDKQEPVARMIEEGWEMLPAITEYYLNNYFIIEKKRFRHHKSLFLFTGEKRKMGQEDAEKTFLEVSEILNKAHIKFYLSDGTMLGAIRNKDFIPWDDDIDLRVAASEWDFSVFEEFERNGFQCKKGMNPKRYQHLPVGANIIKRGINFGIGLNYYYPPEDLIIFLAGKPSLPGVLQPAKYYRGSHFIDFLNTKVRIPYPPTKYVKRLYGKNWKIPIQDKSWRKIRERISIKKYVEYFLEHPEINEAK